MGDINNTVVDETIVDDEGSADLDESQTDTGADPEAEGANKSDDESANKGDEADKGKPESEPTPPADEEPKTRKRNIDFIRERQSKKAEKVANQNNENEDEDDSEIDPSDAKIIQKQVAKVLSPFLAKQMQDEDAQEIGDFVKKNPDFGKYAETVKKFAQHPSRRDMPIQSIFYEVAGQDLLKIGADRARKANDLAKESKAGGGTGTGGEGAKGIWDLTPEEFTARQEELRNKAR